MRLVHDEEKTGGLYDLACFFNVINEVMVANQVV